VKQKHGKTDVVSFRASRDFADLLSTSKLNILELVESGILSHCKTPGVKTEMIINGAINIIDKQLVELQERKDELMTLKATMPAQATHTIPATQTSREPERGTYAAKFMLDMEDYGREVPVTDQQFASNPGRYKTPAMDYGD